ncbi:hypothetical protein E2C01_057195 [Portunus trituberculatus]|uniref:Uncharacterized protein n=1 Tax=Portunus trituberculatus TaxID=210409 RepID=A0A5B7GSS0_PORTR|nr:hypothetical protein [Portunus trituberculatus]
MSHHVTGRATGAARRSARHASRCSPALPGAQWSPHAAHTAGRGWLLGQACHASIRPRWW